MGLWLPKLWDLDFEQSRNCFSVSNQHRRKCGTFQGHVGQDSEKSDLVEDVPAYCRWDQMVFKGPFQSKPFHETKIRKSLCSFAKLKSWAFLVDILGVSAAPQDHLRHMSAHPCLQCKRFWKLYCSVQFASGQDSAFFVWHFNCFYLELSHEFLLRETLLGEELKAKNGDPSGLQTERWERNGKAFGRAGNSTRGSLKKLWKLATLWEGILCKVPTAL